MALFKKGVNEHKLLRGISLATSWGLLAFEMTKSYLETTYGSVYDQYRGYEEALPEVTYIATGAAIVGGLVMENAFDKIRLPSTPYNISTTMAYVGTGLGSFVAAYTKSPEMLALTTMGTSALAMTEHVVKPIIQDVCKLFGSNKKSNNKSDMEPPKAPPFDPENNAS